MAVESTEYDRIHLKNGDIISGQIKTQAFKLQTSYGTMNIETPNINHIDFEGGGQNIDVVVLKIGDKLSGIVEVPLETVKIRSGVEINLDKEKIRKIIFRK